MSSIPYSRYLIYPVTWYSFLIVAGASLALLLSCREEKRVQLPRDTVLDLALWLIPGGIIGARIYYVIFSFRMIFYLSFESGKAVLPSMEESLPDCSSCFFSAGAEIFRSSCYVILSSPALHWHSPSDAGATGLTWKPTVCRSTVLFPVSFLLRYRFLPKAMRGTWPLFSMNPYGISAFLFSFSLPGIHCCSERKAIYFSFIFSSMLQVA